jgi:hypothetical protein
VISDGVGKFTRSHKSDLRKCFRSRNCEPLHILQRPVHQNELILRLESVAIAAANGKYDRDPQCESFVRDLMVRLGQPLPRRRRGKPVDMKQVRIAEAVGWVLLTTGVRSHRSRNLLPRSRDGAFAQCLSVVMDAAGLQVPEDLLPLIARVAPHVEYEFAFGG